MRMKQGLAIGAMLGVLTLAGCHKSTPDEAPIDNTPVMGNAMNTPAPETEPPAVNDGAAETPTPPKPQPQPAPKISADQQMMDDAAATGMTARVDRHANADDSDSSQDAGNNQQQ